jgi:hypothetical protein
MRLTCMHPGILRGAAVARGAVLLTACGVAVRLTDSVTYFFFVCHESFRIIY